MRPYVAIICFAVLTTALAPAYAMEEMSEKDLDRVSAGDVSAELSEGLLRFQFSDNFGKTGQIDGSGTIAITQDKMQVGALILRDGAQGNLRSFININAVNSLIQVLVNLNINIHSVVGSVNQQNLSRSF